MSTTTSPPAVELSTAEGHGPLKGSLGVTAIVLMVVAAAAPLTVIGGVAPLGFLVGNGVGFPALFAISALVLVFFSVGLAAMTRQVPKPGAFFVFVGYGLGRPAGVAAAFLALLTYTAVQMAVYGYIGYILSTSVVDLGGPDLPWYLYALIAIAAVGFLGYRHIDLSSKVLGILLIGEIGIVLVLVAAVVFSGGADGLSAAPFEPANILSGAPGVGLTFAISAFIGFEATAIFRDEAKDPNRTIPRATYVAVIGIGLFYTLASWGIVMAWGPDHVVAVAAEDPGSMVIVTAFKYLGVAGQLVMNLLLITSMFAAILSFHNVITRYQHAMSIGGLLPARIGLVHANHASPHNSSLLQSLTAVVLLLVFVICNLDPVLQIFGWFAGLATLGVGVLMATTSLAVIVYFSRVPGPRRLWNTLVAPAVGFVGLLAATALIVVNFPLLVGDIDADGAPAFGVVSAILLGTVVAMPVIGLIRAYTLRRSNPARYALIIETIGE